MAWMLINYTFVRQTDRRVYIWVVDKQNSWGLLWRAPELKIRLFHFVIYVNNGHNLLICEIVIYLYERWHTQVQICPKGRSLYDNLSQFLSAIKWLKTCKHGEYFLLNENERGYYRKKNEEFYFIEGFIFDSTIFIED